MSKYNKWSSEWTDRTISIIKKTEKEKDANGKETGKDIAVAQKLIDETKPLVEAQDKLNTEITELTTKITHATGNYPSLVYLRKWINNWTNNIGGHNYPNLSDAFHKTIPNSYDFDKRVKDWYQKTYGINIAYKNNLYRAVINGTNHEITEEELLTLMARVVKAFEKVDVANFTTEFNQVQTNGTIQGNLNTWLGQIVAESQLIKVGSYGTTGTNQTNDKVKRKSYDFPDTYTQKHDNNTAYAGTPIYENFFKFMKEVKAKETFLDKLDATKQKEVPQTENYQIFLKGNKYDPKKLKEDYNIEIDENTQELYQTGTSAVNFSVNHGIKGWIDLAATIANDDNKVKLLTSLDNSGNDNPNRKLLTDLLTSLNANTSAFRNKNHPNHPNTFQVGGQVYGLDAMPQSLEEFENLLDQAESQRNLANVKVVKWEDDRTEKQKELATKQTKINEIEIQLDNLLKEELTNLRVQAKSNHIEAGKTFSLTDDNRKTLSEIISLKKLLEDIRFAEQGDEETTTTVQEENQAYDLIKGLLDDYKNSQLTLWKDLAGKTDAEKITKIKETSQLDSWYTEFEKWDKKIKFTEEQTATFQVLKVELGKAPNPTDTLSTYREKLKAVDPLLTDTVITQEVMQDWRTQNNFKTADKLAAEIKKVFQNNALDEKFVQLMKKEDAAITDLAKLFQKKKAQDIITLIQYWEYEQLDDTKKAEKKKQLVWTLEKKDKDGKYLEDGDLTETEIKTVLYEIAIGKKTLASQKKTDETNNPHDNSPTETKASHWDKYMWWYIGIGTPLILLMAGAVIFWKQIKDWWKGPSDLELESEGGSSEIEKEEDDE